MYVYNLFRLIGIEIMKLRFVTSSSFSPKPKLSPKKKDFYPIINYVKQKPNRHKWERMAIVPFRRSDRTYRIVLLKNCCNARDTAFTNPKHPVQFSVFFAKAFAWMA